MGKFTQEDVERVAQEIRLAKDRQRPFAVLMGAGCSISAGIPSAPKLVEDIKARYSHRINTLPPEKRSDYGSCMGKLLPSERKDILQPYLQAAKVNWANLAIAALLAEGYVARVLTFNFDQVLERACGIGGCYPPVYDFGVSPADSLDHVVEGSIIHLHGQSYGMTMMNSDEDTERHASKLEPLLRQTLQRHPLLVIGYSGEADRVFPTLTKLYEKERRENLIWCGYSETEALHIRTICSDCGGPSEFLGGVDADLFLIRLAQALNCWPPLVLFGPERHLLKELEPVLDYPKELGGGDILANVRSYLAEHIDRFRGAGGIDRQKLLLEGKLEEIVAAKDTAVSEEDKEATAWAFVLAGNQLYEAAREEQDEALFRDSIAKYEAALAIKPDSYEALTNWGLALFRLARVKRDEALFRESIAKYEAALAIKPDSYEALNSWGNALLDLARLRQDEALFFESISKYEAALASKPDHHDALNNWGLALSELAQLKRDEALFRDGIAKLEAALAIKHDKYEALYNWGNALSYLARLKRDEALFRDSFVKYEAALAIKPDDHGALNNWGNALFRLAQQKQDEALFRESFAKYEAALAIKPDDHDTLYNWGNALSDLARLKRDETLFRESFAKYQAALAVKPDQLDALISWGNALSDLAQLKRDEALFRDSFVKYEAALAIKPDDHAALYNWGNALSDIARLKQDEALFRDSFVKYKAALAIKPDSYEALANWGLALSDLAQLEQDQALFRESSAKYEAALAIKPDSYEALNNWGNALSDLAGLKQDEALFSESFAKYEAAVAIKPADHMALDNWAGALLRHWHMTRDKASLDKAKDILDQAAKLDLGEAYNGACLVAINGDEAGCRARLERCAAAETLPDAAHLTQDPALESVRGKDWFIALMNSHSASKTERPPSLAGDSIAAEIPTASSVSQTPPHP